MSSLLCRRSFNIKWRSVNKLHRRQYSNMNRSSNLWKWMKRIGTGFGGSISILSAWFYFNHYEEENWRRSLYFWGNLYPIYLHYRFMDIYTKNSNQHDRDYAFNKLHDRYKQKIYDIVIHLQGFYLKLGQLGASRTDIIPIQWVELLRKLEDECPSQPFEVIQNIVTTDFNVDHTSEIFEYIDPEPLGAASIGQVSFLCVSVYMQFVYDIFPPN